MNNGSSVHSMSYTDQSIPCKSNETFTICSSTVVLFILISVNSYLGASVVLAKPRSMVPQKDIAVYGYGSVAWKDRMEEWKKRQNDKLEMVKHEGNNNNGNFGDEEDDPDLPM
jgi:hypothetical protein